MSYAIIRNTKYKRDNLKGTFRHNERRNKNYSNDNIDKEKSFELEYKYHNKIHKLEKENNHLHKIYNFLINCACVILYNLMFNLFATASCIIILYMRLYIFSNSLIRSIARFKLFRATSKIVKTFILIFYFQKLNF